MDEKEEEYKKWEERHENRQETLRKIHDNIHKLHSEKTTNTKKRRQSEMKLDDLLTERAQLQAIIDYAYNALSQHLNFCAQIVGDQATKKMIKKQEIENERFKYEANQRMSLNLEKYRVYSLQITMLNQGKTSMTLTEHNLFIVASDV
eukprot:TRINITY_DN28675_c0_g1_i1.p1 TRINITY_DN28675_c0_g1~~TRINITY_DN28675_c0_g1_i1.p1  ORF type:complete len:148 (-),score=20.58 TRINITY_DN28675_c0_g1_i1:83-526(-)